MTALLAALLLAGLLALVLWLLGGPRRAHAAAGVENSDERYTLERAKQTKYAEIHDNEIDRRTGKLSETDFRARDRELRAQAVEILLAMDKLDGNAPGRPIRQTREPRVARNKPGP